MQTIEIYPKCKKPDWIKPGVTCYCLGEGCDSFIIDQVFNVNAALNRPNGDPHGLESFTKLRKSMEDMKFSFEELENQI